MEEQQKARVQVSFAAKAAMERARPNVGDASIYNIYWDKWYGQGRRHDAVELERQAITRCDPEKDSGLTRAEEVSRDPFFCVFFARGCCGKGYQCSYFHRIPTEEDEPRIGKTRDCFGRDRHRTDREDMAGTGSFERENRTLHISRIGQYQGDVGTVVRSHFGKFGKILAVKVLLDKGMAFVKFACRLNAEFAKEAMNEQALDKDEVLSVRWSVEDLNVGLGDDSREEAQRELAKKLLEDPNRLHTMRLLHDTQSERDLNAYYQQQDLNYSQYQYQHQWAKTTGQEVDSGQVDLNKYYQANPYAYYYQYAQASAQNETKEKPVLAITAPKKAAPPPPPKKDKDASNKKRANEDVSEGEERKIRKN